MPLLHRKDSSSTRRFTRPMSMLVQNTSSGSNEAHVAIDENTSTRQKKKRMSLLKRASISSLSSFEMSSSPSTLIESQSYNPPTVPRRSSSRSYRPASSYGVLQTGPLNQNSSQIPPSPPEKDYDRVMTKDSRRVISAELLSNLAGRRISGPLKSERPLLKVQLPPSPPSPPHILHKESLDKQDDQSRIQSSKHYVLSPMQPPTPTSLNSATALSPIRTKNLSHTLSSSSLPPKSSSRRPLSAILPDYNYGKDYHNYNKFGSFDEAEESVIDGIDGSIGHWISISDSPISTSANEYRHKPLTLDFIEEDQPKSLASPTMTTTTTTSAPASSAPPISSTPISPTFSDQSFPSISSETVKSSSSSVLTSNSSNYNLAPLVAPRDDVKIYQSHGVVYFNELQLLVKHGFKPQTTSALMADENYNPFGEDEDDIPKANFRTQWVF